MNGSGALVMLGLLYTCCAEKQIISDKILVVQSWSLFTDVQGNIWTTVSNCVPAKYTQGWCT